MDCELSDEKDPEYPYPRLFGQYGFSNTSNLSSLELLHHPSRESAVLGSVSDEILEEWISTVCHTSKTDYSSLTFIILRPTIPPIPWMKEREKSSKAKTIYQDAV